MASKRGKRLSPLRLQYEVTVKRIKRLGYAAYLPETPNRVTQKTLEKLSVIENTARAASKARKAAQERIRYYKKKGYDVSGISIPKGLEASEYKAYTAEYIKQRAYSAPESGYLSHAKGVESIQLQEQRYNYTIDIIDRITQLLSEFEPPTNRRNADGWIRRKLSNHRILQMYWFDVVDDDDMESKVKLAAQLEGKAEDIFHKVDALIHGSSDPEVDSANLNYIIEAITGAKLTPLEQAEINESVELGYEEYL